MALIDNFSKEELIEIVKSSNSLSDVILKLGYSTRSGGNHITVKKRLEQLQIDTSHFSSSSPQVRDEENVFIKNSTASQATLRRWYEKGCYTNYECSICGMQPFWQGKELTLILDHVDGDNKNHQLNNLRWVCPNCNQQLETTGFKQMRVKNIKSKNYCIDCGEPINSNAQRCRKCAVIERYKPVQGVVLQVTREELKDLLFTLQNFTEIGKKFQVTDNAVRKWCDKYNLPRTIKEIKSYSKEQWDLL